MKPDFAPAQPYRDFWSRERDELAALLWLSNEFLASLDPHDIMKCATKVAVEMLDADRCSIFLPDRTSQALVLRGGYGWSPQYFGSFRIKFGVDTAAGYAVAARTPVIVPDITREDRFSVPEMFIEEGLKSSLSTPMLLEGRPIGAMLINSSQVRRFTENDVKLLSLIANQTAIALENAHHYDDAQDKAQRFQLINEVGQRITSILNMNELLNEVARLVQTTFGYYNVNIGLVEGDFLVMRGSAGGYDAEKSPAGTRGRLTGQGITCWVARQGQPLLVNDVRREPRYQALAALRHTKAELAVPIRIGDKVLGVLDIESDRLNTFDDRDIPLLESLAAQVAVALENARLMDKLRQREKTRGWLIEKIISAQEDERRRVSRELHDDTGQSLTSLAMMLRVLEDQARGLPIESQIAEVRAVTSTIRDEVHRLAQALRPSTLDQMGLVAAVRQQVRWLRRQAGLQVSFTVEGFDEADLDVATRLPARVEITLYRIIQETLSNVVKHAHANRVEILLAHRRECVVAMVHDDGRGFDVDAVTQSKERQGLGLLGIQERMMLVDGHLDIDSKPGMGTTIRVVAPLFL